MPSPDEALDHTPLTFGKYKGKTPSDVAETEEGASWIKWAYENVKNRPTCSELLARDCGWRPAIGSNAGIAMSKNPDFDDLDYLDDVAF